MKTKLIFSTETKDIEYYTDLSIIPRKDKRLNVLDILKQTKSRELKSLLNAGRVCEALFYH